jgi:hypothetical protein
MLFSLALTISVVTTSDIGLDNDNGKCPDLA